jgi:hypothetical protein
MATPFTALGRGNGFNRCISKIDVSGFDHFEPLTLSEAMNFIWNVSGATTSFLSSISKTLVEGGTTVIDYTFNKNSSGVYTVTPEPVGRTCLNTNGTGNININPVEYVVTMTESELTETDGAGCNGRSKFHDATFGKLTVLRMYNGSTDNESNFVGYGISGLYSSNASSTHLDGALSVSANINISSIMNGQSESGTDGTGTGTVSIYRRQASVLNINGINFRSYTEATASGPESKLSPAFTVNSFTASVSDGYTTTGDNPSGGTNTDTISSSAQVSAPSMNFYTY